MIIKRFLIIVIIILLALAVLEMLDFSVTGINSDSLSKSDYISQMEEKFNIITESFLSIKTLAGPEEAFVFLNKLKKNNYCDIKVFDRSGRQVFSPGFFSDNINREFYELINVSAENGVSGFRSGIYRYDKILKASENCLLCHKSIKRSGVIGVISFSDEVDGKIFYSRERIYLFASIGIVLILLLILLIKWDTQRFIKEIFDK